MGFLINLFCSLPHPSDFNDPLPKNLPHEALNLCFILCLAYFCSTTVHTSSHFSVVQPWNDGLYIIVVTFYLDKSNLAQNI